MKSDCDIVGVDFESIDTISVRDVIRAYKKEALKVHPDKVDPKDKEKATREFQALNSSYERILRYVIDIKAKEDNDVTSEENDNDETEEKRFMEDNFKNFNFPQENDGSFTVKIQHSQADS